MSSFCRERMRSTFIPFFLVAFCHVHRLLHKKIKITHQRCCITWTVVTRL
uniref:Uncharacterized protein n=1 Tax=Anopheles minimus TaxID=112268 RepID=A0A182WNH1_9DIPT